MSRLSDADTITFYSPGHKPITLTGKQLEKGVRDMAKGKRASRSMGKVQEAVKGIVKKRAGDLGVAPEKLKGLGMKDEAEAKAASEESKQEGLFGPADEIVNALELARSRVLHDIDACVATITKKQSELEYLTEVRKKFEGAIVKAKAMAEEKNAEAHPEK